MKIAIAALYIAKSSDLTWPIGNLEREIGKDSNALKPDHGNTCYDVLIFYHATVSNMADSPYSWSIVSGSAD